MSDSPSAVLHKLLYFLVAGVYIAIADPTVFNLKRLKKHFASKAKNSNLHDSSLKTLRNFKLFKPIITLELIQKEFLLLWKYNGTTGYKKI